MGRMRKHLAKVGKNKYEFNSNEELSIYKYLICRSLRGKKEKELKDKEALFDYYSDWKNYVINSNKDKDEKKLEEFSRHLEQRIRNEQVVSKYIGLTIPILLTAFLTTILGELPDIFNIDYSQVPWGVRVFVFFFILLVIGLVGYMFIDFFNDLINYQTRENLFIDYKKVVDEMIQKKCCAEKNSKEITAVNEFVNFLSVEEDKIELRNISADVDIEMPNMSIHIKQK